MKVYQNYQDIKHKYKNVVVALGNFDGLHVGHQHLIKNMISKAREIQGTAMVFTFYPYPISVLQPHNAPPLLLTQEAKRQMLEAMGVDVMVRAEFTPLFAQMQPVEFVSKILKEILQVQWVYIGYNYTFGHKGCGTPELLEQLGLENDFKVQVAPPFTVDGKVVSSTLIRKMISDGNVSMARKFLGYCFSIEGDIVAGEKRGRTLGFPTANLEIDNELMVPANGVYSTKVKVDGDSFLGVANIGFKPTFHNKNGKRNIEVHLLDFYRELYGQKIKVFFQRRLREEKKFSSVSELISQIEQDIMLARVEQLD